MINSTQIPDFDFLSTSKFHYYHLGDNTLYKIFVSKSDTKSDRDLLSLYETLRNLNIKKYTPNIIKETVEFNFKVDNEERYLSLNIDNLELNIDNKWIILSPEIIDISVTKSNIYDIVTIQLDISNMLCSLEKLD